MKKGEGTMEEKFKIGEYERTYYRSKVHPLFCNIILQQWGDYFGNSGEFQVELGCKDVEHTEQVSQAYKKTWDYFKNNQKELLDIALQTATVEYGYIWEHDSCFMSDEKFRNRFELYKRLQNKDTLRNYVIADRIIFTPILENEMCYIGIRLIEIKEDEADIDNFPQFWIVFEENKVIGIIEVNGGGMDNILFKIVNLYRETSTPQYISMWRIGLEEQQNDNITNEDTYIPNNLGRGGVLTKFERLAPYLSCMSMEPVTLEKEPFYTLPRGARPLGDYGTEQIFLIRKLPCKKWEDCPVFYADLEFAEVTPLAENLATFLKLACMVGSFLAVAGAVGASVSEYERYLKGMRMGADAKEAIKVIEVNFTLPEIDNVLNYVNKLQKDKELIAMGKKLYRQIHKKRGWDDEED